MRVKNLIDLLGKFDPEALVVIIDSEYSEIGVLDGDRIFETRSSPKILKHEYSYPTPRIEYESVAGIDGRREYFTQAALDECGLQVVNSFPLLIIFEV